MTVLPADRLTDWDSALATDDAAYAAAYPGPPPPGPVHTVYIPVHRFTGDSVPQWAAAAVDAIDELPGPWSELLVRLAGDQAGRLDLLTRDKLGSEPIEDLRIDLEDGFRSHRGTPADDADEDDHAVRAARAAVQFLNSGEMRPRSWGVRFRSLGAGTRRRGLRTLDLFLSTVLQSGSLPGGFVATVPKVTTVAQVGVVVEVFAALESALGLPAGGLRFEIQVETPQTILGRSGQIPVAEMIGAGRGRVSGLHFGTYDYTASLGVLAAHQNLRNPVADFAKAIMQAAAAETGVLVSDGSDNRVPVGSPEVVTERWNTHADNVFRAMSAGIYQGWDLHPAQLPVRFAATFAFLRQGWEAAATRLAAYHAGRPGPGGVLDEPATAFALARHLAAALACGAVRTEEIAAAGLPAAVARRYLVRGTPPGKEDR